MMNRREFGPLPYVPVPPVVQFGKDEPSLAQLIAAARKAKIQRQAAAGIRLAEIARLVQESPSYPRPPQPIDPGISHPAFPQMHRTPSPPEPGAIRSALGNILGGLNKAQTVFASEAAGLAPEPNIPGLPSWDLSLGRLERKIGLPQLSIPGISYNDDQQQRLDEIREQRDSGQLSTWQASEEARKVHEELPWWGEIARETVSPLGIATGILGGPAVKGVKLVGKGGTQLTRKIPGVGPGLAAGLETAGRVPAAILKTPVTAVKMTGIARHFKKPATAEQITEAQKAVGGIQRTGNVTHVASIDTMINQIQPTTGTSFIARQTKQILDKYNVSPEWRRRLFFINPYAVADMQHPVEKIRVLVTRAVDDAEAHVGQLMNRINASGDVDRLFKLDKYGMVHAPNIIASAAAKGKPVSKNRVFQFPQKYDLTPEQWAPLNEWYELSADALLMAQKEGVEVPSKIEIGRYFPGYMKWLRDAKGKFRKTKDEMPTRLRPFGMQKKNPLYKRVFDNLETAESLGYRSGASAREDMTTYFRFIYQSILEERVGKIIRTYSKTLSQRTVEDLTGEIRRATTRSRGLLVLHGNFKAIEDAQGWLTPGTNWQNRDLLSREAPELLRELEDPKWLEATVEQQQRMLQRVKARIKTLQQEAEANKKLLKNTQNTYKQRAQKKLMETTMPTPRMRGQIFTPEEFAHRYSPTMDLDDVKFLTTDEIKTLTNLFEPHQNALLQSFTNVNLAIRTSMAGFDLGAGQIHGALMMSTMPLQWMKVQSVAMRALFDPGVIARKMKEHQDTVDILNNTGNLDAVQSDFVEAARPGGLIHKLASGIEAPLGVDIPVWTKTVGKVPRLTVEAFERQFSGFITYGKVITFEALQDTAIREGGPDALVDLSQHVSKMFGTLSTRNLGTVPIFEQFLSAIPLFAPRYRMATWGLMLDATRGGMKGELARDALGKLALVGIMTHYAIAKGLGQEPKLDPSKGDFLTVQIGDIRVGWGTAYRSTIRMILATTRQMAEEGFVEGVRVDKYDNKLGRAMRYSTSPVVGTAWDTITGRSALGDPIDSIGDFIGKVPDWTLPFWLSGMMDNPRPGWQYMPLTFFGANAHAISDWDRYKQSVETTLEKEWNDIGKVELSRTLNKYPELRELKEQAQSFWDDRGMVDEWTEWNQKSENALEKYNRQIQEANNELWSASLDDSNMFAGQGKNFREAISDASAGLATAYKHRAEDHPELVKMMNENAGDETAPLLDQAKDEYMRTVVLGDFDIKNQDGDLIGEFNYEAYRKAKSTYMEKWGPEFLTKIQESIQGDKRNPTSLQLMRQDIDDIKVYWEVGEAIIRASGNTHLLTETEGKGISIWSHYLSSRGYPDKRKQLEADHPTLRDMYKAQTKARILLREKGDGQLEEKLMRWNFVQTARNRNNMTKPLSELRKIPLDYGRARITRTPLN